MFDVKQLVGSLAVLAVSVYVVARCGGEAVAVLERKKRRLAEERKLASRPRSETFQKDAEDFFASVSFYERHVVVGVGGDAATWPAKVEEGGSGDGEGGIPLVAAFARSIKELATAAVRLKVTASSERAGDVFIFPDNVRFTGVSEADVESIVSYLSSTGGKLPATPPSLSLGCRLVRMPDSAFHVLVCAHARRDDRCGRYGPEVLEALRRTLAEEDKEGGGGGGGEERPPVHLHACSHVGGHKFAGNVIVYGGGAHRGCAAGAFTGDWYGCVTAEQAPRIVREHIRGGQVVKEHWRGRMGLSAEQQRELFAKLGCTRGDPKEGAGECECGSGKVDW